MVTFEAWSRFVAVDILKLILLLFFRGNKLPYSIHMKCQSLFFLKKIQSASCCSDDEGFKGWVLFLYLYVWSSSFKDIDMWLVQL